MALKIYLLQLLNDNQPLEKKRKVEHLLVKYSGVKISLGISIDMISSVETGQATEVLFNSTQIKTIQSEFSKYGIEVSPKI